MGGMQIHGEESATVRSTELASYELHAVRGRAFSGCCILYELR